MTQPNDFEIEETSHDEPERVCVYGPAGIGKTTFLAAAPNIILLDLESGSRRIAHVKRNRNPILNLGDLESAMDWIDNGKHGFTGFAIDPLDTVEELIHRDLCEREGVESIEDAKKGYGRGHIASMEKIRGILAKITRIVFHRNMSFVGAAHSRLAVVKNPTGFDYQRSELKLHEKSTAITIAAMDHAMFATRNVVVTEAVFDEKRARAVSTGERVLRTAEGPAHIAKSRARLPDPIPLSWHDFVCHLATAGWPRLLRETVADNARRLGNADTVRKVEGMLRENPDVGTLAAANKKLSDLLAAQAPGAVVSQVTAAPSRGTEAVKEGDAGKAVEPAQN